MSRSAISATTPILALLMAAALSAQSPINASSGRECVTHVSPVSPESLAVRFQSELDALRLEYDFPGATAAFALPSGVVRAAATGLADVERGLGMTPESRMLAASIGKTFVAAEVLALAAEGRLGLDDPVARSLGDRSWYSRLPNHDAMSIRHLLTHTSGLPDHVESPAFLRAWVSRSGEEPPPPDSLVAFILDREPLFRPGHGWAYTDTGYVLLGLIVETVTGARLYDEIDRRFLQPLGLDDTSPSDRRELPGLAAGYPLADNPLGLPPKTTVAPGVMAWDPGVEWAGGGLVSTSRDLAVWARELYEGRALDRPYLGELLDAVRVDPDSGALLYGAAVAIRRGGPLGTVWGHGGDIPGYTSSMRYYADCGVAVAFQVNGPPSSGDSLSEVAETMELRLARVLMNPRAR